jgi:hypothetical protein
MGLAYDEVTAARIAMCINPDDPEYVKRRRFLAHAAAIAVREHALRAGDLDDAS